MEDFENIVAAVAVATRITGFINASGLQQLVCAKCCDETVDISFYDKNRKRLYDALTAYGYEMPKPEGAFYLFMKTPTENDLEFVEKIKDFADTRQWVRLSRLCADCVLRCAGDHRRGVARLQSHDGIL